MNNETISPAWHATCHLFAYQCSLSKGRPIFFNGSESLQKISCSNKKYLTLYSLYRQLPHYTPSFPPYPDGEAKN